MFSSLGYLNFSPNNFKMESESLWKKEEEWTLFRMNTRKYPEAKEHKL